MPKNPAKKKAPPAAADIDAGFLVVVDAFAADKQVRRGSTGKGFGAGALKVNDKIFAMISSKGRFVVKLPKDRVDELVASGKGEHFDAGSGRLMKEWIAVGSGSGDWVGLAGEARRFVGGGR